MGNRISRVYTRSGDTGSTGLGDGSRTGKDSPRIAVIGAVDELNSVIGLLLTETLPEAIQPMLTGIQHDLFDLGGELSIPDATVMTAAHIGYLEKKLDGINDALAPLKEFILPGGHRAAALCHLARSVCRRAECLLVTVSITETINPQALIYLNRLSDLFFVCARYINKENGYADVLWQKGRAGRDT